MAIKTVSAQEAAVLVQNGAMIVDIRSAGEFAHRHITDSHCIPFGELDAQALPAGTKVIFSCLSGTRTRFHAKHLEKCAGNCDVYLLKGGLHAWQNANLPVSTSSGTETGSSCRTRISVALWGIIALILLIYLLRSVMG